MMQMKYNKKTSFGFVRKTIFTLGSVFVFFIILVILLRKFPHAPLDSGSLKVPIRNSFKRHSIDGSSESSQPDNKLGIVFNNAGSILHDLQRQRNNSRVSAARGELTYSTIKPTQSPTTKTAAFRQVITPQPPPQSLGVDTVLLIICSDSRPEYLARTLEHVLKHHPLNAVPIVVSEDGNSVQVRKVVQNAQRDFATRSGSVPFIHIHHEVDRNVRNENGYFKLADHFKWALNRVFLPSGDESLFSGHAPGVQEVSQISRVIILEEDLQIAPDFFEFFGATASLLDHDESVLAVSAWNDNGMAALVRDNQALYRSDFFPGLGWMLSRRLWVDELAAKWPRAYWDDWLREPKQRKGRHIIRPEVCRTLHFGTHGVSNAQYSDYLNTIRLNDEFVAFSALDLNYLARSVWDRDYLGRVRRAPLIGMRNFGLLKTDEVKEVRVGYTDLENSFPVVAHWAGAMDNVKAGVPRTAYKGVVSVWKGDIKVHLVPPELSEK